MKAEQTTFNFDDPVEREFPLVPHGVFLSWSREQRLRYCIARDIDSAEHADDYWHANFYLERAKGYESDLEVSR